MRTPYAAPDDLVGALIAWYSEAPTDPETIDAVREAIERDADREFDQ